MLDCFKSAGDFITEDRDVLPFEKINLNNNVDLIIDPNPVTYIKVSAGDNLIDGVITEIEGNTLYIRNENRCNWMRSFDNKLRVTVGVNNLTSIDYYGSGDISCIDTIRSPEFEFNNWNGSGSIDFILNSSTAHLNNHIGRCDIHAHGIVGVCYIYVNDVATLDASNLTTYYNYITNKSTGDCRINVKQELGAEIKYSGNIYYTGNPLSVIQTISGDGKLIAF
jgi:hypothetical protein